MEVKLSYQQKVLLAALALSKEYNAERGYEFYAGKEGDLILTPWHELVEGKRTYFRSLRVTKEKIFGNDKDLVSELEKKVGELYQ